MPSVVFPKITLSKSRPPIRSSSSTAATVYALCTSCEHPLAAPLLFQFLHSACRIPSQDARSLRRNRYRVFHERRGKKATVRRPGAGGSGCCDAVTLADTSPAHRDTVHWFLESPRAPSFLLHSCLPTMDLFPTELWEEVFAHLPLAAHRSLSSTHRMLYDIARPFGFTEFTLYTYPYGLHPQSAQLDDALERLRFWTSPEIAPHVRSCTTSQKMHWQRARRRRNGEHALMSAFFERLPLLTGLERLAARDIRFTDIGITNLCGLPALTHLEASGRTVLFPKDIDPALKLRVASFAMKLNHDIEEVWFSVLSRDTLRELDLLSILPLIKSGVGPFPNVLSLTMNSSLTMHGFVNMIPVGETMNKFPNLRSFSTTHRNILWNLTPAQESSIFPVLEEYTGAYQNLHIFAQRTTLTHITLPRLLTLNELISELQGITSLPNITFFAVRFVTSAQVVFGEAEIETLFTLFPNLAELQLTFIPAEHIELLTRRMNSFLKMLPSSPLPSTLHSLSLRWDLFEYNDGDPERHFNPDAADIPDFPALRAELVAKCPALTYINFDQYHLLFLWRKTSSVWETTAYSFGDAQAIREQLKKTP
ncbi:hypothetical protein C8R45DRAFT_267649 [Mycena sanguinolenta]|nr:hypothetical protein C8R45DRAFT_267649 [Mycena sanguinolenta]